MRAYYIFLFIFPIFLAAEESPILDFSDPNYCNSLVQTYQVDQGDLLACSSINITPKNIEAAGKHANAIQNKVLSRLSLNLNQKLVDHSMEGIEGVKNEYLEVFPYVQHRKILFPQYCSQAGIEEYTQQCHEEMGNQGSITITAGPEGTVSADLCPPPLIRTKKSKRPKISQKEKEEIEKKQKVFLSAHINAAIISQALMKYKDEVYGTRDEIIRRAVLEYFSECTKVEKQEDESLLQKFMRYTAQSNLNQSCLYTGGNVEKEAEANQKEDVHKKLEPLRQIARDYPTLFQSTKDESLLGIFPINEMSPSPFMKEILKQVPIRRDSPLTDKVLEKVRSGDLDGINQVLIDDPEYNKLLEKLADNPSGRGKLNRNAYEAVNSLVTDLDESALKICKNQGRSLHHYPDLVQDAFENDPNAEEYFQERASYCHLSRNYPAPGGGLGLAGIAGFVVLGTGAVVTPFIPPAGAAIMTGGGALLTGVGARDAYLKQQQLGREKGLYYSGWQSYQKLLDTQSDRNNATAFVIADAALLPLGIAFKVGRRALGILKTDDDVQHAIKKLQQAEKDGKLPRGQYARNLEQLEIKLLEINGLSGFGSSGYLSRALPRLLRSGENEDLVRMLKEIPLKERRNFILQMEEINNIRGTQKNALRFSDDATAKSAPNPYDEHELTNMIYNHAKKNQLTLQEAANQLARKEFAVNEQGIRKALGYDRERILAAAANIPDDGTIPQAFLKPEPGSHEEIFHALTLSEIRATQVGRYLPQDEQQAIQKIFAARERGINNRKVAAYEANQATIRRSFDNELDEAFKDPQVAKAKEIQYGDLFSPQFRGSVDEMVQSKAFDCNHGPTRALYNGNCGLWWSNPTQIDATTSRSPLKLLYGEKAKRRIFWPKKMVTAQDSASGRAEFPIVGDDIRVAVNYAPTATDDMVEQSMEVIAKNRQTGEYEPFFYVKKGEKWVPSKTFMGKPVKKACMACHQKGKPPVFSPKPQQLKDISDFSALGYPSEVAIEMMKKFH